MADEVYQLKVVNQDKIKLGKGPDADDEFTSFKDLGLSAIVGFMYLPVQIQGQNLILIIPATRDFNNNGQSAIVAKLPTRTSPWPIISICSYNDQSISPNTKYYGLISPSKILIQKDAQVLEVDYIQIDMHKFIGFR